MSGEYDNNNRGACWSKKNARSVTAEINHRQFYGDITPSEAKSSKAPLYNLYLRAKDRPSEVYCVAIFKKDEGGEKLAGGDFTLQSGHSFWVSLFKNKSEKERSPTIDLSFQAKEAQTQEQAAPQANDEGPEGFF